MVVSCSGNNCRMSLGQVAVEFLKERRCRDEMKVVDTLRKDWG